MRADLHLHSTYSDGSLPPSEIISLASARGLSLVGITDHDTVEHFPEALAESAKNSVKVLPGVEFSTILQDRELHILGYAVDHRRPELRSHLEKVRSRRLERARIILERLAGRNVHIPAAELDSYPADRTIGRMVIARLMYHYGYVRNVDEAFDNYLGSNAPAFVAYKPADAREVLELIRRSGGVSVLAHPSREDAEKALPHLHEAGLDGIETWRPILNRSLAALIRDKAQLFGLVQTGGSDWHYDGGRLSLGAFHVNRARLAPFLELLGEKAGFLLEPENPWAPSGL